MPKRTPKIDEIGPWSEVKLDILKRYAVKYSTILAAQQKPKLHHCYIDAFAGAGVHFSKSTSEMVPGSPLNALHVSPPFREFFLIDLDSDRVERLQKLIGPRDDVHLYAGDCNEVLLRDVFPKVDYKRYRRGLCILDPYKMNLRWSVIQKAGEMQSVELFINFPIMDINRNVLRHDTSTVDPDDRKRMNELWGDESWESLVYETTADLFGAEETDKVASNAQVAEAFRQRLIQVAGFARVPKPLAMKNKNNAVVYYLFFASHNNTAEDIVKHIFDKYEQGGGRDVGQFKD